MKKEWKKEDIDCKHIGFSNKEEENKLIKFLTSLGLEKKFAKDRTEDDNCFYISGSSDYYFTDKHKNCELKYSDIFPEESFKQEQQFEAGKWYKWGENFNHYFKPSESSILFDTIKTSEDIHDKIYRKSSNNWTIIKDTKLLTDLSEIQQYLPFNHEDLINTAPKEESFAILLNNQEEWQACVNWTISKNYFEYDTYNTFKDQSPCYFIVNDNKWYCMDRNPYFTLKTLSDIGITINKEEKKYDYEVVHCKTQQEWDFVLSKFNPLPQQNRWFGTGYETIDTGCGDYLVINKGISSNILGVRHPKSKIISENPKIYSFEEWCNKFGHKPDFMNKEEDLLGQAKRRYKIGDKVQPVGSNKPDYIQEFRVVYPYDLPKELWVEGKNSNILLFRNKQWATIIEQSLSPIKEEKWIIEAKNRYKLGQKVLDLTGFEAIIADKWEILGDCLYNNGNLISQI